MAAYAHIMPFICPLDTTFNYANMRFYPKITIQAILGKTIFVQSCKLANTSKFIINGM